MNTPDVNYREYADSKQCFFHSQKLSSVPYENPMDILGSSFVREPVLITDLRGEPIIVKGYFQLVDGKIDENYVYGYCVHKERRQSRIRKGCYDGAQYCGKDNQIVFGSQWTYTFYRIPTKNVVSFNQKQRHFEVRTVSNAQREYMTRRMRGYPQEQSNGWFPGSSLTDGLNSISQVIRGLDQKWLDYTDTKYIEIRIDRRDGAYLVKDMRGEPITNPDKLRNIFSGTARPRS